MVIFALISFPNHYNFRSYAHDLAFFMQYFENYLNGYFIPRKLSIGLLNEPVDGIIYTESHISPSILTALPFYWAGSVWGLLLHQWLSIGFMAIGFFAYARHRIGLWQAGYWTMVHFFGMWGITSLLAWDWHEVVAGIVWLPWFFYALEAQKLWLLFLSWFLFIGAKENFALWGIWLSLSLLFAYKSSKKQRLLLWLAGLTTAWFALTYVLFKKGPQLHSAFSAYEYLAAEDPLAALQGKETVSDPSIGKILRTILLKPQLIWSLLFESTHPDLATFGIKSELHWAVLWSGGWSFIFQPIFLILLIPVYLYKLLPDRYSIWGTLYHYNTEFAAILPIAVLWTAERWRGSWRFWVALIGGALGAHLMNFSLLDHCYSKWYDSARHRWYQCEHYHPLQGYDYEKIHEGLKLIPREAGVSASSRLAPHIPARLEYYHFPVVGKAEYIALLRNDPGPWPLTPAELTCHIDSLEHSPYWEKIWDKDQLVIFRRRSADKSK